MGLKAVAIYRDNCKVGQPLSMAKKDGAKEAPAVVAATPLAAVEAINSGLTVPQGVVRRSMAKIRSSKTFSFTISDSKGHFTVGEFEDGTPGEIFISTAKMGSTLRGLMDAFAISISYGLQYGVPLKSYVRVFSHMSFAPSGITDDPDLRTASSIVDYIFRRLALTYLSFDDRLELGLASIDDMPENQTSFLVEVKEEKIADQPAPIKVVTASTAPAVSVSQKAEPSKQDAKSDDSAPMCFNCGNQTQRAGSCYVCTSCGSTTGCS